MSRNRYKNRPVEQDGPGEQQTENLDTTQPLDPPKFSNACPLATRRACLPSQPSSISDQPPSLNDRPTIDPEDDFAQDSTQDNDPRLPPSSETMTEQDSDSPQPQSSSTTGEDNNASQNDTNSTQPDTMSIQHDSFVADNDTPNNTSDEFHAPIAPMLAFAPHPHVSDPDLPSHGYERLLGDLPDHSHPYYSLMTMGGYTGFGNEEYEGNGVRERGFWEEE